MTKNGCPKIGILGGAFNPIHIGHLIIAQEAVERLGLEEVVFIPCAISPHKRHTNLADANHRLRMIQLAIEGDSRFEVSDLELRRGGVSYTVDTVSELRKMFLDKEFVFITGSDTLQDLRHWRRIHDLLHMCRFVVFARPGFDLNKIKPEDLGLDPPLGQIVMSNCFCGRLVEVSSSEIRRRVAEGLSIKYLVPNSVERYIAEHGLYR